MNKVCNECEKFQPSRSPFGGYTYGWRECSKKKGNLASKFSKCESLKEFKRYEHNEEEV